MKRLKARALKPGMTSSPPKRGINQDEIDKILEFPALQRCCKTHQEQIITLLSSK
jgi:hypothetical protein